MALITLSIDSINGQFIIGEKVVSGLPTSSINLQGQGGIISSTVGQITNQFGNKLEAKLGSKISSTLGTKLGYRIGGRVAKILEQKAPKLSSKAISSLGLGGLDSALTGVVGQVQGAVEAAQGAVSAAQGAVSGAIGSVASQVQGAVGGVIGSVSSQVEGVVGGVVGGITNDPLLTEFATSTVGDITKEFTGKINNEINSSIAGLNSKIADVTQEARLTAIGFLKEIPLNSTAPGLTSSIIKAVNAEAKTITVETPTEGVFTPGMPIIGLQSRAIATIAGGFLSDSLDLLTLFGDKIPKDFSLSKFISDLPTDPTVLLKSTNLIPNLSEAISSFGRDVVSDPSSAVDGSLTAERKNPIDPSVSGLSISNERHRNNVANEPVDKYEGEYPYNKSYRSESGHLIEIDDTPGKERLLNEHISGTYTEMKTDGTFVTKVVKDNYTIVCADDYLTVEGKALIHISGDCQLRVGGVLTITSDMGINMSTKGDFRLKAKSINMESTDGDISTFAANSTFITAGDTIHQLSGKNLIEAEKVASIFAGEQFIADAKKISQKARAEFVLDSEGKASISSSDNFSAYAKQLLINSKENLNLKSDEGKVVATGSTFEIDATLNVKSTTNLKATGTDSNGDTHNLDVTGQGAAAASPAEEAKIDKAVLPEESKGSGITFIDDPYKVLEATDDDTEESLVAIKDAIDKGVIKKEELDEKPPEGGETDSNPPATTGDRASVLNSPTIKDVGSNPPDNLRLSSNFVLSELSSRAVVTRHKVVPQMGLTSEQIVQNLQLVAQNCLEKIRAKYPNMFVTSGFRTAVSNKKSTSQHLLGQAVDMQFKNTKKSEYFAIAQWIKDNVPYDQLLLEYKSTQSKMPWIHISFVGKSNRNQVLTFWNHSRIAQGLKDLSDRG